MRAKLMRLVAYLISVFALAGCYTFPPSEYTTAKTTGTLLGAFYTPDGKVYLLGQNNDYEVQYTQDIKLMFQANSQYAVKDPTFRMWFGDPTSGDQVKMIAFLAKTSDDKGKSKAIMNTVNKLEDCDDMGEYFMCMNSYYINTVRVQNREQILKGSAFPKPFSVDVLTSKKKSDFRLGIERAKAKVDETLFMVTAPIWVSISVLSSKNMHIGG